MRARRASQSRVPRVPLMVAAALLVVTAVGSIGSAVVSARTGNRGVQPLDLPNVSIVGTSGKRRTSDIRDPHLEQMISRFGRMARRGDIPPGDITR